MGVFGFGNKGENSQSFPSLVFDKLLALKCGLVFLLLSFSFQAVELFSPGAHSPISPFFGPMGISSVFLRPCSSVGAGKVLCLLMSNINDPAIRVSLYPVPAAPC